MDETLYLLNFALLFTHQVDSAYWKEWEMFRLPGGLQLNLALNFGLLVVALAGFWLLLDGAAAGYGFALALAAGGVVAFALHSAFLVRGHPAFRTPASLLLLAATLPVSLLQAAFALAHLAYGGQNEMPARRAASRVHLRLGQPLLSDSAGAAEVCRR